MKIKIMDKLGLEMEQGRIGLFFEDINYGLDGGLHAEMIENRSFEFFESKGTKDHYVQSYSGLYGWNVYPKENEAASMRIQTELPLNDVNPHYLEFTSLNDNMGFSNKAYDGIFMKKDLVHHVSFQARSDAYAGQVQVMVCSGDKVMASAVAAEAVAPEWTKYTAELTSSEEVRGGTFVIKLSKPGRVCFDFISMMPGDAVLGLFRRDLAELLKEMKPGFLRFPGGCVVEGNTMENRYQWKRSIGAPEQRKANWNRWAVYGNEELSVGQHSRYSHYNQSLGIGFYEYFLLCEYLEARPLPVLNVGVACQFQSSELVSVEEPAFREYVQDILDLIEFANGPADSAWGAARARMGHPNPFGLELVGIGNEQWETDKVDFFRRYDIIERAVHGRWPEIKLIGSAGPDVSSDKYSKAWKYYADRAKDNASHVYAVDEHYYVKPEWMIENIGFYDNYPRNVKVFAGEYAAHHSFAMNRPELNDWNAALAEAAFMTGLEWNADLVVLASYAPLLARIGYTQWSHDLVWFNGEKAYGSPSYYVQKLYSTMAGTNLLVTESDTREIPYAVTYDKTDHSVIVKLVNPSDSTVLVKIASDIGLEQYGDVTIMQGENRDVNSIEKPEMIAPKAHELKASQLDAYEVGPRSFHVIRFGCVADVE